MRRRRSQQQAKETTQDAVALSQRAADQRHPVVFQHRHLLSRSISKSEPHAQIDLQRLQHTLLLSPIGCHNELKLRTLSVNAMSLPDHLVCFSHGKESGPWGTKITHLSRIARNEGFDVISVDYTHTQNPHARVDHLRAQAPAAARTLVLAGSSLGGYVSAMACRTLRPKALFLMAPALYFPGFDEEATDVPALCDVVHGWDDDVVPVERALRFARGHRAHLHLLDSGHTLNDRLPRLAELFTSLLRRARAA